MQLRGEDSYVAGAHGAATLGRSCRSGRLEVGALDLTRLVRLEHVALFDVVEALEQDAALEALLDLAHVVLDAPQRRDRRLVDDGAVPHDAHLRPPADDTARDHAAGDRADARRAEQRAHLGLAERRLGLDRFQHADERLLDVLGQLVDDAVRADLDADALGQRARLGARAHVEADDQRAGGAREVDVVLRDAAHALVNDVHANFGVLDLLQLGDCRLDGADDVALQDQVQLLDGALLHLREQLAAHPLAAAVRERARLALVLDDACRLSGRRRLVEAEDLDRRSGRRLLQLLAAEVIEGADARPRVPGDDRVADAQRSPLDEHRRGRAAALVEARLDDRAGRLRLRIRLQLLELDVGDEQHLLEQLVESLARLGGNLRELRRAAPLLRLQPFGRELAAHLLGICVRQVDLVDRDDDRDLGGARVRDRLLRLRHHAVVGRHDEHRDVGDLRTARAHRRERLVARRVDERDLASLVLDLIRADVLRDPPGLRRDDGGLADLVEQRRLTVIDVAHDRDDRWPQDEIGLLVLEDLRLFLFLADVRDRHLALQLGTDQLDLLVGERLRRGPHLAEVHQDLDQLRHRYAERLREVADRDA